MLFTTMLNILLVPESHQNQTKNTYVYVLMLRKPFCEYKLYVNQSCTFVLWVKVMYALELMDLLFIHCTLVESDFVSKK